MGKEGARMGRKDPTEESFPDGSRAVPPTVGKRPNHGSLKTEQAQAATSGHHDGGVKAPASGGHVEEKKHQQPHKKPGDHKPGM